MKTHKQQLEDDLQSLGLTKNEGKILIAMIKIGTIVEASRIASLSGVPRSKIYQILEGLIEKKIITMGEVKGKANIYHLPFNPDEMIILLQKRVLTPIEEAAGRSIRNLSEIANSIKKDDENIHEVSLIQGQHHIDRIFKEIIDSASESIITNITPEFLDPIIPNFQEAKERGVEINLIMMEEEVDEIAEKISPETVFSNIYGINLGKLEIMFSGMSDLKSMINSFGIFLVNRPILLMIDPKSDQPVSFLIIKSQLGSSHNIAVQFQNKDFNESISSTLSLILKMSNTIRKLQDQFPIGN